MLVTMQTDNFHPGTDLFAQVSVSRFLTRPKPDEHDPEKRWPWVAAEIISYAQWEFDAAIGGHRPGPEHYRGVSSEFIKNCCWVKAELAVQRGMLLQTSL
jgi:hypothetical protein